MLRKLAKDVAAYGGIDFLFRAAQFVVLPIYAHLLTLEQFGVLALLQVSTVLVGLLLNLGVNNAVQRFYFDEETAPEERPLLVSTGLAQLTATLLVGLPAAAGLAWVLFNQGLFGPELAGWLIAIALLTVLPEQIAQYTLDAVRLQFSPPRFLAISLIKNFAGLLLGLWLATRWELGVGGILLGTLVGAALAVPVGLWCIRRDLRLAFDSALTGRVLRFGTPYVLAAGAYWVFGSMDRWLIAALSDVEQVGLFSIAIKYAGILAFMMTAFGSAWSPFAYRLRLEDQGYRAFYARVLAIWFALLTIAGLGISLFATEVLMLLTPPSYWAAAPSISVCAAGLALYGSTLITTMGIQIEKRTMLLTWGAWITGAVNVLANLVLVPGHGALGAAGATLLTYAVLTSIYLSWSQRLHPIPLNWRSLGYSGLLLIVTASAAFQPQIVDAGLIAGKLAIVFLAIGGVVLFGVVDTRALCWWARSVAGSAPRP